MRIVVTGGTGMIGRPLITTLATVGHEVIALSRDPDRQRSALPDGVGIDHWDARTLGDWARHVDGADAVVNFAGEGIAGDSFLPDRWTAGLSWRRFERPQTGRACLSSHRPSATMGRAATKS